MKFTWTLVALTVLLMSISTVSADDASMVVRMVQIAHRHGARNAFSSFNVTEICGTLYPCGDLTNVGQQMLLNTGEYMRKRYNDPAIVGPVPFFATESYNASMVYSRSTSTERTLQSSTSFLHGLFPNSTDYFPVVYTVNMTTDLLGVTDPNPVIFLKRYVDTEGMELALQPYVDMYFTWEELQALAIEAYIPSLCTNYSLRFNDCASTLYDITASFNASGWLDDKPLLKAAQPRLDLMWTEWFRFVFGWNPDNALERTEGSSGQFLAAKMIENMEAYFVEPTFKMYEYSAHDTTIAPLGITFGDQGNLTMLPQFAVTMMVELIEDTTNNTYYVRVLRGWPTQNADGRTYQFMQWPFAQHCMRADQTIYIAEDNICPYEDLARFIAYNMPTQTDGYCVVNQTQYNMMDCPTRTNMPLPHYCALYRTICPAFSCPAGSVLSAVDSECYSLNSNTGDYDTVLTQVIHRNGATTPIINAGNVITNSAQVCGEGYQCGELTETGMDMMLGMGEFVQARLNNLRMVRQPMVSNQYNSSLVYSRSVGVGSAMQSATAFLAGLFPNHQNFYPIIYTNDNIITDFLLNADALPPVFLKNGLTTTDEFATLLNPVVDASMSWADIQAAAAEAGIADFCSNEALRYQCALQVYQIAVSYEANGQLAGMPNLQSAATSLADVQLQMNYFLYSYNTSVPLDVEQGSLGQTLAQQLLSNIQAHLVAPTYSIFEYSAQEGLMDVFAATLGDQQRSGMLPAYAESYLVELLKDTGDSSYHVRVVRGAPQVTAGSSTSTYGLVDFTLHCTDSTGTTYVADKNICPLADFTRYIDATGPTSPNGFCAVDASQTSGLGCPASASSNEPVEGLCRQYRSSCPASACPADFWLSAVNLQCYPMSTSTTTTTTTTTSTTTTPAPVSQLKPVAVPLKMHHATQRRKVARALVEGVNTGVSVGVAIAKK